jgi:hypothetical protein
MDAGPFISNGFIAYCSSPDCDAISNYHRVNMVDARFTTFMGLFIFRQNLANFAQTGGLQTFERRRPPGVTRPCNYVCGKYNGSLQQLVSGKYRQKSGLLQLSGGRAYHGHEALWHSCIPDATDEKP